MPTRQKILSSLGSFNRVVGETGVGISTFIKYLLGDDHSDQAVEVRKADDADLESCTTDLKPVPIKNAEINVPPGRQLVILDTPGFNNSNTALADLIILQRIEQWLSLSYSSGIERLGVIYLHDITQSRVTSETLLLFRGLRALCRKPGFKTAVLLGTAKWPGEDGDVAKAHSREDQLENKFWKEMIGLGAGTGQFKNTKESACEIVQQLLQMVFEQGSKGEGAVATDARKFSQGRRVKCVVC
ncbi:hypothetical protein CPB84DRAFT_183518 [Gymnopilus junonius]|uniref:G domain-containing protein n=1 Tax=Gymnopilus junonius TaxID=109634 RepID=A0A9P5TJ40_GYMJU|nr:hypothetical protein CPB84DRAFT_183518 [Gymnopilus junonius]